jgi:predicted unusual protein kinase regulating ubiquinone biosynthesis (AarF/ABC1/UbiB family)
VSDVEHPAGAASTAPPADVVDLGLDRGRLGRSGPLLSLTARTAGEAVVAGLRGKLTGTDSTEFHVRTAERYVELLGRSKGALMKAGQMLSLTSAGPFMPLELRSVYQAALTRLYDDVPPMAPELACAVLEDELGQPLDSLFSEFECEPLAAASVGQVHAARLHDGRAVAVKIQYPGVGEAIAADLRNAELLATFLRVVVGGFSAHKLSFDIGGMAHEISVRITEELDYRLEAANQAEFAEHYRGHPFIHVPEVIGELCSGRVLTQELALGLCWNDARAASQELRDQWAEAIYRFAYGGFKRLHLFNADPHPGNYVLHHDGSVSFLDFGCVKRFRREQVEVLESIVRASLRSDALGTWRACVEAGFWRATDPVTPEEVFEYWREDGEMMFAPQRFVVTPAYVGRRIERRNSPNGPSGNAFRHITASPEYTLMSRIETGVACVVSQLRGGAEWGLITAEYVEGALPQTAMGIREQAFFEARREAVSA